MSVKGKLLVAGAMVISWNVGGILAPVDAAEVNDFANYPANSGAPEGCDYLGISGVSFNKLDSLNAGDTVIMSWGNVSEVCNGSPVTLAIKSAPKAEFDPVVDQHLEAYATTALVGGNGGSLSLTLPNLTDGCFYQLDAVIGNPLAVVGPSGSFYGSGLRGDGGPHMLIAFSNGGYETCGEQPVLPPLTIPEQPPVQPPTVAPEAPAVPSGTTVPAEPVAAATEASTVLSEQTAVATSRALPLLAETGARGTSLSLTALVACLLIAAGYLMLKKSAK